MTKRMETNCGIVDMRVGVGKWNKCVCGKCRRNAFRVSDFTKVSVRKASAMTAGSYPKTTIYPYRYATGGSANQLIPMTAVSGAVRRAFMLLMDGILEGRKFA